MKELVYFSFATEALTGPQIEAILKTSQTNNLRDGLTGVLLYNDRNFIQILEGPSESVDRTFKRIHKDPRHKEALKLHEGPITRRAFPDWQMGYHYVSGLGIKQSQNWDSLVTAIKNPKSGQSMGMRMAELMHMSVGGR